MQKKPLPVRKIAALATVALAVVYAFVSSDSGWGGTSNYRVDASEQAFPQSDFQSLQITTPPAVLAKQREMKRLMQKMPAMPGSEEAVERIRTSGKVAQAEINPIFQDGIDRITTTASAKNVDTPTGDALAQKAGERMAQLDLAPSEIDNVLENINKVLTRIDGNDSVEADFPRNEDRFEIAEAAAAKFNGRLQELANGSGARKDATKLRLDDNSDAATPVQTLFEKAQSLVDTKSRLASGEVPLAAQETATQNTQLAALEPASSLSSDQLKVRKMLMKAKLLQKADDADGNDPLQQTAFLRAKPFNIDPAEAELLGPGDKIALTFPGEETLNGEFSIDREGRITLPEVGPVSLSGLTMEEAETALKQAMARVFRNTDALTFELKERKLFITVLGYVTTPGEVELPRTGNVQTAITAAGGLAAGAQLDKLQVRRGTEIFEFDYKEYLSSGDVSLLPPLRPLDVIFVPASPLTGNVQIPFSAAMAEQGEGANSKDAIKIFGAVRNPTTLKHKPGLTLVDAMMRSGGITAEAAPDAIRIVSSNGTDIIDLKRILDEGEVDSLPELPVGATIYVPKTEKTISVGDSFVYIIGEVIRPGAYKTQTNVALLDILANAGGPGRVADLQKIKLIRKDKSVEVVDLKAITEGEVDSIPEVQPGDTIFIPAKREDEPPSWLRLDAESAVKVIGAVGKPGRYEWDDEMSLFDLLSQAGGPTRDADLEEVKVLKKQDDGTVATILFDMADFIENGGDLSQIPEIRVGDVVSVPLKSDNDPRKDNSAIKVIGEVGQPGAFEYEDGRTIIDYLTQANGVTRYAAVDLIKVLSGDKAQVLNLQDYLNSGDPALLPELNPGALIFVPRQPEGVEGNSENTIYVMGEVTKPGGYERVGETTFIDMIAAAGGPTRFADTRIIRVIHPTGEVTNVDLPAFTEGRGGILPMINPGDTIFVPESIEDPNRPSWTKVSPDRAVEVMGAVTRPDRYEWSDEMSFFDLLANAGGPTVAANLSNITILTRVDGRLERQTFDMRNFIENGGSEADIPKITGGSIVNVPTYDSADPQRPSWLRVAPDAAIEVIGAVQRPDRYEWSDEMTILDILAKAGGPIATSDVQNIQVSTRENGVATTEIFNLQEFLSDGGDESDLPRVTTGTVINVPFLEDDDDGDGAPYWLKLAPDQAVEIMGAVRRANRYEWADQMTLFDLIGTAGGPVENADMTRIQVLRRENGELVNTTFNMQAFVENGGKEEDVPFIDAGSIVNVPYLDHDKNRPSWLKISPNRAVEVIGAVQRPDRYEWSDEMTFFDLIAQAGGPQKRADISKVQILVREKGKRARSIIFDMEKFMREGGNPSEIPIIRAGYVINLPFLPDDPTDDKSKWIKQAPEYSIYIMGNVGSPGRYAFKEGLSFLDILGAADGPRPEADLRNIRVSHRNRGDASVSKVNLSLYFETGDEALLPRVLPGDVIYVPGQGREWLDKPKEQTVRVIGAIGKPGRYRFDDNMTILDLLAEAGGPTPSAMKSRIVVVNLSKSIDQAKSFNLIKFAKTGDTSLIPIVRAGDTIFVPDEKDSRLNKVMDTVSKSSAALGLLTTIIRISTGGISG